jgi:hypothetical protein
LDSIARLRPGLTLAQAAGRVDAIANTIRKDRSTTHGVRVHPLVTVLVGDLAAPLALLLTAVALLLLIACGNAANLLLARSASRGREFAVRTALGADRRRLASLVMVESMTRAAFGGLFGADLAVRIGTRSDNGLSARCQIPAEISGAASAPGGSWNGSIGIGTYSTFRISSGSVLVGARSTTRSPSCAFASARASGDSQLI